MLPNESTFLWDDYHPYPGTRLSDGDALTVIEGFRAKYHHPTTRQQISPNLLHKAIAQSRSGIPVVPLTWVCFPQLPLPVSWHLLSYAPFLAYPTVYFSVWATGNDVYQATPQQVQDFLRADNRRPQQDYYVFPETLRWCVVVTLKDDMLLTGDFQIF
jgi:hypothetical protein